ncbi:MAG: imidazoleglycerol-phosphate dehydratase HisB [Myxococcota bacterium]
MPRTANIARVTSETSIQVSVNLDGTGSHRVQTPIGFLTHMLEQIPRHGPFDLELVAEGDTHIDGHHTTEDVGIALGQAVAKALGDKQGIYRYGSSTLPMDEACVSCTLDLSGRPYFVWRVPMPKSKVGDFDTELAEVFFEGFARGSGCNLHLRLIEGSNLHHIIEISFKSFAKSLRQATELDPRQLGVPSTKGTLSE